MSCTNRLPCEECQFIWFDTDPPCDNCFPGVHPYNEGAVDLHNAIGDQFLSGPGGVMGLNDLAINMAFDNYFEILKEDRLHFSKQVRSLSHSIIEAQRAKASEKK